MADQRGRAGADQRLLGGVERGGESRAFAALRRAGDPHAQDGPGGGGGRAVGVGQEAVGAVQRDEGTRHGGDAGDDPASVQVADAVRLAGTPEGEVEEGGAAGDGDAEFAGEQAARMVGVMGGWLLAWCGWADPAGALRLDPAKRGIGVLGVVMAWASPGRVGAGPFRRAAGLLRWSSCRTGSG